MCGICGEVRLRNGGEGVEHRIIRRMCQTLSHRGPDDEGFYFDYKVGLGHRRLSIIDLETGKQPMSNEDDTVWIVFNGEIYNYKNLRARLIRSGHHFKSDADTEVLLHLYEDAGGECVKHLRGMFAFAIWDSKRELLLLARDRIGQKPLFYTECGNSLIFASEIKALLSHPSVNRTVNPLAVHDFLSFKFIPRQEDLFKGIHKLPPASVLIFQNNTIRIKRYWELYYQPNQSMTEEYAIQCSEELLLESVKMRLMSDVPLGAFLSSGIDSGLIVNMMSRVNREPINSFSIGSSSQGFNELPHARLIAQANRTNHREFVVNPDAISILPDMIYHMDGPYADVPALPMYYVSKLARKHITVTLTGDGGDELFAGYDRYVAGEMLRLYRLIPFWMRKKLVPRILALFKERTDRKSWRQTLRWFNAMSMANEREAYARGISFFSFENDQKDQLYTPLFKDSIGAVNSMEGLLSHYWSDHANDALDKMCYSDMMARLPEYSHIKVDRISMMHGLEARSPFMDHKLIEFSATIPSRLKMKRHRRKYLLRRVSASRLPSQILNLPKQGFASPINRWLRGELKGLAHTLLDNSMLVKEGFFNQAYIDQLLACHEAKIINNGNKIWSLVNLETWYRTYFSPTSIDTARENVKDIFHSIN